MWALAEIIRKNREAEAKARSKRKRPESFNRHVVNVPWPSDSPACRPDDGSRTPPHGDPFALER